MIFRLLQMPVIDVLLLLLLARIIFPSWFGARKRRNDDQEPVKAATRESSKAQQHVADRQGEYIDYEEIK